MESVESSPESGVASSDMQQKAGQHYVTGFLFSENEEFVVLVEKRRPAWQVGRLNGIGGRIEPGETPAAAMRRESIEEAGVDPEWSEYACVEYAGHVLHFFAARDEAAYMDARAQTDEELMRFPVQWAAWNDKIIPNLRWLIPLACHHIFYEKVVLAHVIMSGGGSTISRKM